MPHPYGKHLLLCPPRPFTPAQELPIRSMSMNTQPEKSLRGRSRFVSAFLMEGLELRELLSFNPTGAEQQMLELLNRMRAAPAAELPLLLNSSDVDVKNGLKVFGVNTSALASQWAQLTPAQPLAWNASLLETAKNHSAAMLSADAQEHQLSGEADMGTRATAAGYDYSLLGENIFAYAKSVFHGHAAFAIDWGTTSTGIQDPAGHRQNMMDARFNEVGIGIVSSTSGKKTGPLLITEDFGRRDAEPYVLGVAYFDRNHDGLYTPGEGLAGVDVTISGSEGTYTTRTYAAGGYQLQVPAGDYTVTFSGAGLTDPVVRQTTVGSSNVKVDLFSSQPANTGQVNDAGQSLTGRANDIVYDSSGQLVMAWYDPQDQSLKLSVRSPEGDWGIAQTVDSSGNVGGFLSLALDSHGWAGIAYYDATNGDLKYAHWNGSEWRVNTIDAYRTVGLYPSLAYDANDNPIVSYYDKTHGTLRLRSYDGTRWRGVTVARGEDVGRFSSLQINPVSNRPAVAYEDSAGQTIRYAQLVRNHWTFSTVDDVSGGYVSLAFDAQGRPNMSYYDAAAGDLKFGRWAGGAWQTQTIASQGTAGLYSNLAIDAATGATRIVYYNRTDDTIGQASLTAHGWKGAPVLSGGRWLSLALRPDGGFSMAWSQSDDLKVADM